ncbi:MAG TPA: ABC transporter ATP-binding protein, partial [bacterium]|nr:ABC transporter ATP-binding protein [bacterium]
MLNNYIIQTFDLSKVYKLKGKKKEITALNNVNISIRENEIFGLLGPNGAGKTTMIQILTTLLQPTSGYALIDGFNIIKRPKRAKNRVALMLESSMLYYRITGFENLKFFCKIYQVQNYREKIYKIADELGLTEWLKQYVEYYSSGMKMKLALCRTLLLERKILFLDEPTLGLDVSTKNLITDKLRKVKKTIFLCSHDLSVVEKLCDRVAFINKGTIQKIGTKEDIRRMIQTEIKLEVNINKNKKSLKEELLNHDFITEVTNTKKGYIIGLEERKN